MDDDRIAQYVQILITCHGSEAEDTARKRTRRCLRRGEPEWAHVWCEVADQIAKLRTPALT